MFPNKYLIGLKQYMAKFLGERYAKNQDAIDRVGHSLVTEQDFSAFMTLMVDVYESAYLKAIEDCRKQFEKHGIQIEISGEAK